MEITQEQKIESLKGTIEILFEKEGRSKIYISKLLEIDIKDLSIKIRKWGFKKANTHKLKPSSQKFANKHKQLIKLRLDNDVPITEIANELGVTKDYLQNIIYRIDVLDKAREDYIKRKKNKALQRTEMLINKSCLQYDFKDIDGEEWKEILGYDGYYISNMGRVKRHVKKYDRYILLSQQSNCRSGRMYIKIKNKGLAIARLVGFAFVEGYSEINNTIDHIDGNEQNNKADNLQWIDQSYNNKLAYDRGRSVNIAYQKRGKFKKIVLNDKYEFKTITALAKFLGKSWTQTSRYLDGECKFDGKLEIIY